MASSTMAAFGSVVVVPSSTIGTAPPSAIATPAPCGVSGLASATAKPVIWSRSVPANLRRAAKVSAAVPLRDETPVGAGRKSPKLSPSMPPAAHPSNKPVVASVPAAGVITTGPSTLVIVSTRPPAIPPLLTPVALIATVTDAAMPAPVS